MASVDDDVMLSTEPDFQRKVSTMSIRHTQYDGNLQMFVEPPCEPDMARLTFLRWLIERRRLEHEPAGAPSGELVKRESSVGARLDERKAA